MIFQKLWVTDVDTPPYVLYILKHHVTGEAWPADSDSTLNFKGGSRRGGESNGVKCRIIRKRRELFPVFHVHMEGASSSSLKWLRVTMISDGRTDGHVVNNNKD